jgi:AraC-like DNA-binding protein
MPLSEPPDVAAAPPGRRHVTRRVGPIGRRSFRDRFDARCVQADIVMLVSEATCEELELRRRAAQIACAKPGTREELVRRIRLAADFIASHHEEPISLDEMARAASLSRFHFGRLFSLVHGETPHAFLLRKRTAVALRHLAVGAARQEAAARAGFGSRSALFRSLRKSSRCATAPNSARSEPCFLSA